jgi:hypothetical protein
MESPTYEIRTASGVRIAADLPRTAPAIQLHEGTITEPAAPYPKDLAPGEYTTVDYPLDGERGTKRRMLRCTVTRTDAPEGSADTTPEQRRQALVDLAIRAGTPSTLMLATGDPSKEVPTARGGRRSRGGKAS